MTVNTEPGEIFKGKHHSFDAWTSELSRDSGCNNSDLNGREN
jgi:hypothetical protein